MGTLLDYVLRKEKIFSQQQTREYCCGRGAAGIVLFKRSASLTMPKPRCSFVSKREGGKIEERSGLFPEAGSEGGRKKSWEIYPR